MAGRAKINLEKRAVSILLIAVLFLSGCTGREDHETESAEAQGFSAVKTAVVSGGREYAPSVQTVQSTFYVGGNLTSASGVPFVFWLGQNIDSIPVIQYTGVIQVIAEGEYSQIACGSWPPPEYFDGMRLISIRTSEFSDGIAYVSPPDKEGRFVFFFDVVQRRGNESSLSRNAFIVSNE